jgi:hypothetical protein
LTRARLIAALPLLASVCALAGAGPAAADVGSLKSACIKRDAADGNTGNGVRLPYLFCDDGLPSAGGRTANAGAMKALAVPERYDGFAGLPKRAAPEANAGADASGNIALDADVSLPDPARYPPPPGGYPLIVLVHTCCSGDKHNFEAPIADNDGELWHYNNAWYASRGYVVLTYTSRGFVDAQGHGSTGEMQLDSRRYEANDFQHLACQLADDSFFHVDPSRVVVSGSSYGGGLAWMAVTDPTWSCATLGHAGVHPRVAAAAPKYGWGDLMYALVGNGTHRRDALPPTDPAHA